MEIIETILSISYNLQNKLNIINFFTILANQWQKTLIINNSTNYVYDLTLMFIKIIYE